jgi:hypothetical protein
MDDLTHALADISAIRAQIARVAQFRGYGPATVAATSLLAVVAGATQRAWIIDPVNHLVPYLAIWLSTAASAVVLTGIGVIIRSRRVHPALAPEIMWSTVEDFLPVAVAGMLVALVIIRFAPVAVWMIPGLWQVFFSLGIFAACRSLPRELRAVGFWYFISGSICLTIPSAKAALSPWAMALPFGAGQMLAAVLLQFTNVKYGKV